MEISKAYQALKPIVANVPSSGVQPGGNQQVGDKTKVADLIPNAFQIDVQDEPKIKLAEFANILQNREQLIQSLPENVKKAVLELLQQMSTDTELPQGLENLLKGQKNAVEQLKDMSTMLNLSGAINKEEHSEIKTFLQGTFENFTQQTGETPEQSAKELVQLAKQLWVSTAVPQGDFKETVEQFLQQTLPENMQQLNPDEQKALGKLAKLLGQDMPVQLQQLTKQNNIPELPLTWGTLKASDAWQFKDMQPKTLQATADLLQQIAQEISPVKGVVVSQIEQFVKSLHPEFVSQGTVSAQLEQLIKTLPPEMAKALQKALQQGGNIPDNLRSLADILSNAEVLNKNMNNEVKSLLGKMGEAFATKGSSISTENPNVLSPLTKQSMDVGKTIEQLKIFINQLKTQLFAGATTLSDKDQHMLDQIAKLLEPNIPQVLQESVAKSKLPELPKIWTVLKALEAEQWQNIESGNLQKAAGVVKELAQSIYKLTGFAGEQQAEHSTLSFSVPLQVAEGIFYPAHIHIYHEEKENSSQPLKREFETWLRVSVDTENIGVVDSVFRLYGDNKLDVRVNLPSIPAANQFAQNLPEVRKILENSKLKLTDITINKP